VVVPFEEVGVRRVGHGVGKFVVVLPAAEVVVELELDSVVVTVTVVVELAGVTVVVVEFELGSVVVELDGVTVVVVEVELGSVVVAVIVVELEMDVVLRSTQVPLTTLV